MTSVEPGKALLAEVLGVIEAFRMITPGAGVVAAVSGGPDSVALFHVLHILSRRKLFRITVAHLDHLLRAESGKDAAFVRAIAEEIGIAFKVKEVDVKAAAAAQRISVEEAGRRARYDFFESIRVAENADVIATGHHLDDEIETFFLRTFRGSSLQGLGGIAPVHGRVIRPLIRTSRAEILTFLKECNLPYRVDRTNLQDDTDRNFIRNRLIPSIAARFEDFRQPIRRTMEMVRAEDFALEQLAAKLYAESISRIGGELSARVTSLLRAPDELISRVVLSALYNLSGPNTRWSRSHVSLVLRVLKSLNPSARADLASGIRVRREYDLLIFGRRHEEEFIQPSAIAVTGPGQVSIPASDTALCFNIVSGNSRTLPTDCGANRALFDADEVGFPLSVRFPQPGDRFKPWGVTGSRKLKKVLIDLKVPRRLRSRIPLVVKEDEILWIAGIRRGQAAPMGPETKRVLDVSLIDGGWLSGR